MIECVACLRNGSTDEQIETFGLPLYLSRHPQRHLSLFPTASAWKPKALIRHHHAIASALSHRRWHALQIGPTWRDAVIPTLSVSPTRLVLGVGGRLIVHPLVDPPEPGAKRVGRGREYMIAKKGRGSEADIVGALELGDDELAVAQYDGTLQRYKLDPANGSLRSTAHYAHPAGSNLQTLAIGQSGEVILTTTTHGYVSLFKTRSPWVPPDTFALKDRAWSSMASTRHSSLSLALYFGVAGGIAIHPLRPSSGPDPRSERLLIGPDLPSRSTAYDMTFPSSPSAHHPSLLLSSWFDSYLRLHDLRTASREPVLEFFDPWQWADGSAIYSTTYLAEHHIAGGGARHGTVSLFDIRQPKAGWSVFTPGGKGSPVYALQGEGGRLWGVTEKRAFMLAFDGSGDRDEGMVKREARAPKERAVERPSKWNRRGGKWGWTVRYDEPGEGCSGYDHKQSGVALFDSLQVV